MWDTPLMLECEAITCREGLQTGDRAGTTKPDLPAAAVAPLHMQGRRPSSEPSQARRLRKQKDIW